MYDFAKEEGYELAFGLSMQVRNANIEFWSVDGSELYRSANVGPVPILKSRGRMPVGE
jgi:hypothetical protein